MKKRLLPTILALLMLTLVAMGCPSIRIRPQDPPPEGPYPAPRKEWSHTFGGRYPETARSVQQTAGGGFIIAGTTWSFGEGEGDFWLVKTDTEGNKQWSQTFGGPQDDQAYSVEQTACGGFIVAGTTESFGEGEGDFWLVKTDPQGNKEWSQTFGGPEDDRAFSLHQTACGGFIIAGTTESFGEGESDLWLIKTDTQGDKRWSRTFGGPDRDGTPHRKWARGLSVQQTACGGFITAGTTWSFGEGEGDFWLVKTDTEGNKQWSQTFGGPRRDWAASVQQTACGGFIIAGATASFGAGGYDFWVIKTDYQGNKEWSQTFSGGPGWAQGWEKAYSIQETADGGFVIAGYLTTAWVYHRGFLGMGVTPAFPYPCIWIVRTDPVGNIRWTQTFGTRPKWDIVRAVKQTACGGFIIAGWTESFGEGESDFWLIKLAPEE